jgi:DNA-binding GntR family transcriptional regulator
MENNPNIWESVYRHLRKQVTFGLLNPGEKLDEEQISNKLGVSRTPVREALKQLQAEGYIESIPKKGSFVTKYSTQKLSEIYDVLIRLEGLSVYFASKNLGEKELCELEKMHARMKEFSEKRKYEEYVRENNRFHLFFHERAKNTELNEIIRKLRNKVFRYRYIGITIPGKTEQYVQDHEEILAALRSGSRKRASRLMEMHVDRVKKILLDYFDKFA